MFMPITLDDIYVSKKDSKKYFVDNIYINSCREAVIVLIECGYDGCSGGMRINTTEMIDSEYILM